VVKELGRTRMEANVSVRSLFGAKLFALNTQVHLTAPATGGMQGWWCVGGGLGGGRGRQRAQPVWGQALCARRAGVGRCARSSVWGVASLAGLWGFEGPRNSVANALLLHSRLFQLSHTA
jgi:hypothetical protein